MNNAVITNPDGLTWLGRYVVPWAIKYRNQLVLKCMGHCDTVLDIGCGPAGWLLKNASCRLGIGLDKLGSIQISKNTHCQIIEYQPFPPSDVEKPFVHLFHEKNITFDCVTMVAVVEHIKDVKNLFRDIYSILKVGGYLIITTPVSFVEKVLFFLDRGSEQLEGKSVDHAHHAYYTKKTMNGLLLPIGFTLKKYKKFQLGLNQLFIYKRV